MPTTTDADDVCDTLAKLARRSWVMVRPALLGDGTRLFDHPGGSNVALEQVSVSELPNDVNLWFGVLYRT